MSDNNFVHLHVHSHYSLYDSTATVKGIVDEVKKHQMPAVAITDHGNMFSAIELFQYATKHGVKPIIGFEAYVCSVKHTEKGQDKPFHLILLAENNEGYKNIVKLSSKGYTDSIFRKPRIDFELLEKFSKGIIALGACLEGEIPRLLSNHDKEGAIEAVKRYQRIFGKENFYLELQNHGISEQMEILKQLVEVAKICDAPIVATNDCHYTRAEDWEAHDALLCIGTDSKLEGENRFRFPTREFYLKSPQKMIELFSEFPDAITNTIRIAKRCNVNIELGKPIFPHFPTPEGKTSRSFLTELCHKGLVSRYGSKEPGKKYTDRLALELEVISKLGFCDYFLIVWDLIDAAKKMKVPVGPGRGSTAGSIVNYLLGITDVDPIKYGLLFERFLNPDRCSMPDIDIDFSDDGRKNVIQYVIEKYGRKKVSEIIIFGLISARQSIQDIGDVMGMQASEIDRIKKHVPWKPGMTIKRCIEDVPELREMYFNGTKKEKKLLRLAEKINWLCCETRVHSCGIIISRQGLEEIIPVCRALSSGQIVTQYDKYAIEDIGILKMDFLGLKNLTIIKNTITNINKSKGVEVNIAKIDLEDKKTFKLLQASLTQGVFLLESSGMRDLIAKLQPSGFEDIIALLTLYRPAPLGSGLVDFFIDRKHGREKAEYLHPDIEQILKETYGVLIYQEQCMKIAKILANFTMAQADKLRKELGKKIPETMKQMEKLFVKGAGDKNINQQQAKNIFDWMASFGEYGFNKSHSAAYALIAFRTAYLKAHYPIEFMTALLSSEQNNTDKLEEYIDECCDMEITILSPDINASESIFTVEDDAIRYGLSALEDLGNDAVEAIISNRKKEGPYKSLEGFIQRLKSKTIDAKMVGYLIQAGTFDRFGLSRGQLMEISLSAFKTK
jgi:DNA polymerase-3 subunit alpha